MRLTLGVVQSHFTDDMATNISTVEKYVRDAAAKGAKLILTPELFQGHYFCVEQDAANFKRAYSVDTHPAVVAMRRLAAELKVFLPVSFFEQDNSCYYNSVAMIDDKGSVMGTYRKTPPPPPPPYSRWSGLSGKVLFSPRRHRI